jgi:hypothetical protein
MKSKTSATLMLVGTFLLGGITGGAAHFLYQNHVRGNIRPAGRRDNPGEIAQQMARTLQLDDAQKEKMKAIFKQGRERFFALSEQFRPQYQGLRDKTNEEIRQILREDQKVQFDAFLQDMEKRAGQRRTHPR